MFAAAISGRFANFAFRNVTVASTDRPYSHDMSPSANMFFDALRLARRDALDLLQRADRERRQRHRVNLELVERAVLERVRGVARLLEVALVERIGVDDQRAALRQVRDVRLQRSRIHRDEHVRRVARREDVVVGEVELEAGDAGQRAGGRADLGREVRQRRDVVPERAPSPR